MAKTLKAHKPVGEDFLAGAKTPGVVHRFSFPAQMVWNALLDGPAWTEWLPITKVTWTSPKPFGPGTTRTVEIGAQVIEETFFAWEDGKRMAFRFERSSLPISAAVEDYRIVPVEGGCEMRWRGKATAPPFFGAVVTGQLTKGLKDGMPKLEALIAKQQERFK